MKSILVFLAALSAASCAFSLDGPVRSLDETWDNVWSGNAILFSPYRHGQSPTGDHPDKAQILEDLRLITPHWHFLRVGDSGKVTETILTLIKENQLPARILLQAELASDSPENTKANDAELQNAIRLANAYPDIVCAVIVGSRTQSDDSTAKVAVPALIAAIRTVRAGVAQPVTTSDDVAFWFKKSAATVADEVDFISLRMTPMLNGTIPEEAIPWTDAVFDDLENRYPGKAMIIGEAGWPTQHDPSEDKRIKGETSVKAQSLYLKDHYRWIRLNKVLTVFVEAFDQEWRGDSGAHPKLAEKHAGLFDENRRTKASLDSAARLFPDSDDKVK